MTPRKPEETEAYKRRDELLIRIDERVERVAEKDIPAIEIHLKELNSKTAKAMERATAAELKAAVACEKADAADVKAAKAEKANNSTLKWAVRASWGLTATLIYWFLEYVLDVI